MLTTLLALTSWPVPRRWHPPRAWLAGALCIHRHESGDWHLVNGYAGGMQFTLGTWQEAGGPEDSLAAIAATSPRTQLYRAYVIWKKRGWSHDWPTTSRLCGLA